MQARSAPSLPRPDPFQVGVSRRRTESGDSAEEVVSRSWHDLRGCGQAETEARSSFI